jgi:hypothetical protein
MMLLTVRDVAPPSHEDDPQPFLSLVIQQHPTFAYRRLWAMLRLRQGQSITQKTV